MCGICGFAGNGSVEDLRNMINRLIHRGPDGSGEWVDTENRVFLGHRRLSIIDIECGKQPMISADESLVVLFNGEIYNHQELRIELQKKGYIFKTSHSDTEVLLHGYREWKEEVTNHLNGMWAFALYDRLNRRIFLSRDRFGKKPLFYTYSNGVFAFASELTSLTEHSYVNTEIGILNLKKYFAYGYIPAPGSLYKNIYKLPGGHSLVFELGNGQCRKQKYWEFKLEPVDHVTKSLENSWCEQIRDTLERSVKRRLISDVPLGVFLSGGIDSTAIAYYACKDRKASEVNTLSVGFDEKTYDESCYSQIAADFLGTNHHATVLTLESALDIIPELVKKLDEPMGDSSLIATYLLCREARKKVTVALGGDGADELFAGYDPFAALRLAKLYDAIVPRPLHRGITMLMSKTPVSHVNMSFDFKIKRALRGLSYPPTLWNPVWLGPLSPPEIENLFREKTDPEELYSEAIECWESCTQTNIVDKTLQFYTNLYLQDDILVKIDRAGMLNSLEVRAPFLDVEMAEIARKIPSHYKFRNGQRKYILKKALEPLLPKEIISRKKKGFGVPLGRWFKDGAISLEGTDKNSLLDKSYINSLVQLQKAGKADNRAFLWNYVITKTFLSEQE